MSRLSKNIFYNLLGQALLLVLGFVAVKYIFGKLGEDALGIINYENIKSGNFKTINQNLNRGSFHYRKELDPASEIFLDKKYIAKDLMFISQFVERN